MTGEIKNYHEHLRISGWQRVSQNLWYDDGIYMFNVYYDYEDFCDYSEAVKGCDYIYCLELEGNCIKIGYSADLKRRIEYHIRNKKSDFKDKIKRIGILGPIKNGKETEKIIHYNFSYYYDDIYDSSETYFFDDEFNSFDTFMILFQFFQSFLLLGEIDYLGKMNLITPVSDNIFNS